MIDLTEIRTEIDRVDSQIVELFEERMELAGQVAESKRASGKAIYDKQREEQKLAALGALASDEFNRQSVQDLFSQIMAISRMRQYRILGDRDNFFQKNYQCVDEIPVTKDTVIVYQGVEGAFSEEATCRYFGEDCNRFHVDTFEKVVKTLEEGNAQYGVLPIENSSAGFVSGTFDLLSNYNVTIVDEVVLKIEQALLALPGTKLEDITTVYSHPQGLMQSKEFLEERGWNQISMANTALSAKKVKKDNLISQAAIASKRAATLYGLEVLQPCVSYNQNNSTRFVVITRDSIYRKDANKISISFSLPHQSGSLYNMLAHFIFNGLNMTSIESSPLPDKTWEYRFFVTFNGNLKDSAVQNALTGIRTEAVDFELLGNY